MSIHCQTCSCDKPEFVPPEPPIGSWVKDKYGIAHYHQSDEGWGDPGFYATGRWAAMWAARGPMTPCGPGGRDLPSADRPS